MLKYLKLYKRRIGYETRPQPQFPPLSCSLATAHDRRIYCVLGHMVFDETTDLDTWLYCFSRLLIVDIMDWASVQTLKPAVHPGQNVDEF